MWGGYPGYKTYSEDVQQLSFVAGANTLIMARQSFHNPVIPLRSQYSDRFETVRYTKCNSLFSPS